MLEQQGWDGSKKRPGDVTCDSEPLGLPGRRTIFDTTVVAMQAPARLATVVKALGTQITGRPWAWVDGKGDVRQAMDAAAAGARERKLRLYTDMTVEKNVGGSDIVRPEHSGRKWMRSLKQSRSAGFSGGQRRQSGWRGSRFAGRGDGRCGSRVLGQWPRVCGRRQWWGARAAGTTAKLPQATDTVGLLLGCGKNCCSFFGACP